MDALNTNDSFNGLGHIHVDILGNIHHVYSLLEPIIQIKVFL